MAFDASQFMSPTGSDYEITNSLKFDSASSAKLTNTFASAGNRRTFTFSTWVKRSTITGYNVLFGIEEASDGSAENLLFFDTTSGNIRFGWNDYTRSSAAFFKDVSGWYHVLLAVDTTQSTAADRIKIYVNGVQITVWAASSDNDPDENEQFLINKASEHHIGVFPRVGAYANVYMAETHFIDGAAKAPADFGEFGDYGEFKPIAYAGSYGDEGFYLDYKSSAVGTASSSTIGADRSGNTNHWSSTNITVSDQMIDTPTNNVTTLNPLSSLGATEYSEGNLKFKVTSSGDETSFGTIGTSSGKWYFEVFANTISNAYIDIGVGSVNHPDIATPQSHMEMTGYYCLQLADNYIKRFDNGAEVDSTSVSNDTGDIIMIAYDVDNNKFWAGKDGTWLNSGNPAGGANAWITMDDGFTTLAPAVCTKTNDILTTNFGQDSSFSGAATAQGETDGNGLGDFYYEPPSGFLALCTKNLPEPAIVPTDYFNTVLYTGNGSTQDITSVGFSPNLTWIKNRAATDANQIFDSVRGVTKTLDSGSTVAETVNDDTLTHFLSNGFTTGDDVTTNTDGEAYVA